MQTPKKIKYSVTSTPYYVPKIKFSTYKNRLKHSGTSFGCDFPSHNLDIHLYEYRCTFLCFFCTVVSFHAEDALIFIYSFYDGTNGNSTLYMVIVEISVKYYSFYFGCV